MKVHAQELVTDPAKVLDEMDLPREYLEAMARLLPLVHYPVAPDGTVLDVSFVAAVVVYHLARCGVDVKRAPLIKKQLVRGPGIIMDACHWVDANEDNSPLVYASPLDDVENMTMNQINALPEPLKREAYSRLGIPYTDPGWSASPQVNIENAPEGGSDDAAG